MTESGAYNPYRALLAKLVGKSADRLRLKTAVNIWRKTERPLIESQAKEIVEVSKNRPLAPGEKKESLIAVRDRVARSIFAQLPKEDRLFWEQEAAEEHKKATDEWNNLMKKGPSEEPAECQRFVFFCVVLS